jgi:hypothetical protein
MPRYKASEVPRNEAYIKVRRTDELRAVSETGAKEVFPKDPVSHHCIDSAVVGYRSLRP